ncbi:TIGR04086 family membrane protein [Virgibacillus profundi]|uniref:TIGR04086 family membrane protein n=1 Tax=Virgibacillus profundi TaxID=2024555 RepID=A0A2A2ICY7_9BACI|nr:TIGR04086 family membrane protein [Virgibacillus profundi]PAV28933.1 TIGR04086 family membrane protein [Virgibacillus profundi]PXY53101.1 TIGR04086 family membrane protein [Virgibacillus profundi]
MKGNQFIALLYGWIVVLGLILISSVILAFLLRFTTFSDPALTWVALVIGLISLFIGGVVAGVKGKVKGWIIGGITGIGFTLFTFLVQYLGYQQAFSLEQSIHHIGFILAALFGGVIGVNITGEVTNE